jgi:hypothetical protein
LTSQSQFPTDDDDDTIELELTAEELRRLCRGTREGSGSKGLHRLWPVQLAAAVGGIMVVIAACFAWRSSPPHRIAARVAPAPAIASTPPPASQPAALAKPPISQPVPVAQVPHLSPASQASQVPPASPVAPVRVKNPFDPKEVFEFPAGTTKAEARKKVTEILVQRAVDRRIPDKGND